MTCKAKAMVSHATFNTSVWFMSLLLYQQTNGAKNSLPGRPGLQAFWSWGYQDQWLENNSQTKTLWDVLREQYLHPIPPSPVKIEQIMSAFVRSLPKIYLLTLNPSVPQPPLLPTVISFRPLNPLEYRNGFKKPKGDKPAFRRASFNRATIPLKVGAEAEVPPIRIGVLPIKIL